MEDEEKKDEEIERDEREDSDTSNEAEEVVDDKMDSEEAHRYGEFEELNSKLDEVLKRVDTMKDYVDSKLRDFASVAVDNGSVIRDIDDVENTIEEPKVKAIDALDLTI